MMWKKTKLYLIVTSVALNAAFIATWIAHAAWANAQPDESGRQQVAHTIWCPLHRELGVTDEQWAEIEPRLHEFQDATEKLRNETNGMRAEVIELIAAQEPDRDAIRVKQDEILATKRQIQTLVAEHLLAEKRVLTAEQQMELFEMLRVRTNSVNTSPLSGHANRGLGPVLQNPDEALK